MTNRVLGLIFCSAIISARAFGQQAPASAPAPATTVSKKIFVSISDVDFSQLALPPQFKWGGDPFLKQPGFVAVDPDLEQTPDKLHLEAIIFDPEDPIAIVNGKSVRVGNHVSDYVVEVITASYVVVRGHGGRSELNLAAASEKASIADIQPSVIPSAASSLMPSTKEKSK